MQRLLRRSLGVLQHDPQSGPVHLVVAWTNGPRQLRNLELRSAREAQIHQVRSARQRRRIGRQIRQNTPRIVHQISESLRHQESVDVSRRRLFYLLQVVVRQRFHQRYFDRHRWLVLVRYHSYAHRFPRSFHHGNYNKRPRKKLVELICRSGQSEESALSWIRAPRQDRKRPVNLLRQHHACQFVRIRHGTQRNLLLHAFPQRLRESVRIPTNKNNLACSPVSLFTEPFRKGPGIKRLSGRVKQHHCCRAFSLESPDRRFSVAYLGDFDRARPRDALDIVPQNGIHLRSPRPSEHQQPDLHYHRTTPDSSPRRLCPSGKSTIPAILRPLRPEGSKLAQGAFSHRLFPACSWSFYREVTRAALTAAGTVPLHGAFPLDLPAHPPLPGTAPPATGVPDRSSALPAHRTRAQ